MRDYERGIALQLPNRERAVIAQEKLTDYLLNVMHKRGGAKARLFEQFGYRADQWPRLADDIRAQLATEVDLERATAYGVRYEMRMTLRTPVGRLLTVRTVWQIDDGTNFPRLITLFPD